MNVNNKHAEENYIEHGGFFNRLLFLFALPILQKGRKHCLEETDIGELEDDKNMETVYNNFNQQYQKGKEKGNSFPLIFFTFVFDKWLKSNLLNLCADLLNVFYPFIVMRLIDWFNSSNTDPTEIYKLIGLTLLITTSSTFLNKHGFRFQNLIHMDHSRPIIKSNVGSQLRET